ncbi:hypothetical protein HK16_00145 [Acetobacter senegalensis]|uniref:Transposase n=2 Tax=Acetobacter TaxID=434 RepID=A0A252EMR9_9PROT|nr:hypothetical protein CIW82_03130 [Acetobacter tropicalis]OUL67706.1 hypothetical protein HK16_00145 [Acetobacter senegalensis]
MLLEEKKNHLSCWSVEMKIAPKLDIHSNTLSKWTRLHERANASAVNDLPDREKIRRVERGSCGRPMKSCARLLHILPRRNSTAGSGHDTLH